MNSILQHAEPQFLQSNVHTVNLPTQHFWRDCFVEELSFPIIFSHLCVEAGCHKANRSTPQAPGSAVPFHLHPDLTTNLVVLQVFSKMA